MESLESRKCNYATNTIDRGCENNCRLGDAVSYLDLNIYPSICHRSVQAILFSKGVRESQPFEDRGSSIDVQLQLLNNRLGLIERNVR